jgi:colicin import membrane protein
VELAPDGRILNQKTIKSSGVADWDAAVLRALEQAGSLPKDDNGSVPRQIQLIFKPKD